MKQFVELYEQQRQTLAAHAPEAMNACRDQAYHRLLSLELPRKGSENYEATDLGTVLAPDYGVNLNRVRFPLAERISGFSCAVPALNISPYYIVNDIFHPSDAELPAGVVVTSLSQAAQSNPALLGRYYNTLAGTAADPVTLLNTMLAQDGVLVYVPQGVTLDRPLQFINMFNASASIMALRRVLVVLERDARAAILSCDHTIDSSREYLSVQAIELHLAEGASLEYYDMEESSPLTRRLSSLYARQAAGSSLLIDGITLSNGLTRNDFRVEVDGEHCETQLLGMAIGSDRQHIDNYTHLSHNAPRCHSHEMFKYSLDDEAVGAFSGKILVKEDCPGVDAYQGNRNLCGSPEAKMYTKPQLEIYTDDVKCAHGATVGQLDQEALFYMRQRGISLESARTLLKQAFMSDVIDGVKLVSLRERLRHLVEQRFLGAAALCNTCRLSK